MNQTPNPPTEISPNSLKGRITPINMENRSKIKTPPPAPKKKPKNKKKKKKNETPTNKNAKKKKTVRKKYRRIIV